MERIYNRLLKPPELSPGPGIREKLPGIRCRSRNPSGRSRRRTVFKLLLIMQT